MAIFIAPILFVLYLQQRHVKSDRCTRALHAHGLKFALKIRRELLIPTVATKSPEFNSTKYKAWGWGGIHLFV